MNHIWAIELGLILNKALNLTEGEVRYAMENTKSNSQAARFIGCNINTWKKYASRYIDEETGKTLYELHKNVAGKGIPKIGDMSKRQVPLFDIIEGKNPNYNKDKFAQRLLDEMVFDEACAYCGYDERRLTDMRVPIALLFKDGDPKNCTLENLEFACYNCIFMNYGNIINKLALTNFRYYDNELG